MPLFRMSHSQAIKSLREMSSFGLGPQPSQKQMVKLIEKIESLEQLRVLWHGEKIAMDIAIETPGPGIDTEHDLQRVAALMKAW